MHMHSAARWMQSLSCVHAVVVPLALLCFATLTVCHICCYLSHKYMKQSELWAENTWKISGKRSVSSMKIVQCSCCLSFFVCFIAIYVFGAFFLWVTKSLAVNLFHL